VQLEKGKERWGGERSRERERERERGEREREEKEEREEREMRRKTKTENNTRKEKMSWEDKEKNRGRKRGVESVLGLQDLTYPSHVLIPPFTTWFQVWQASLGYLRAGEGAKRESLFSLFHGSIQEILQISESQIPMHSLRASVYPSMKGVFRGVRPRF
jgi:hypothetical protein